MNLIKLGSDDQNARDENFMYSAIREAYKARDKEEVPIGAVIVFQGSIIARAYNQVEMLKDATAHAEMIALTTAQAAVGDWRLNECDLYVTKEPCVMCAGAIVHCRVKRLIFGCEDKKTGASGGFINLVQHDALNHKSLIKKGVLEYESSNLLKEFFQKARKKSDK